MGRSFTGDDLIVWAVLESVASLVRAGGCKVEIRKGKNGPEMTFWKPGGEVFAETIGVDFLGGRWLVFSESGAPLAAFDDVDLTDNLVRLVAAG